MSEYTPTLDEVREDWCRVAGQVFDPDAQVRREKRVAAFNRMIAEVERAAVARALAWAAEHLSDGLRYEDILEINSWEAVTVCAGDYLRARAAEYRKGEGDD